MNCSCIRFSLHFSFSSFAFCFLNSTLFMVSLVLIVSAADTPLIGFLPSYLNPKLFSSSLLYCSTLIKPLPTSFLFTGNLSTSLQPNIHWWNPPDIAIVFLDFIFKPFSSLAFHWIIPALCLSIDTAHVFIAVTLFLPFNLDFKTNLCFFFYFLFHFCFFGPI